MVAVAVVLILAAVILTVGAILGGSETTNFDIFQGSVSATGTQIFLLGLVTGLLFIVGAKTLQVGARRARKQGKELRELRAKQREVERRERETRPEPGDDSDHGEPARQSPSNPFDIDDTTFRSHRFRDPADQ